MKNTYKSGSSQLISYRADSYFDRTSRPIYALIYLLGFIVLYELGTLLMSPQVLTTWIATPLVVVIILLALQITSGTKWRVYFADFIPMTLECILLAGPLITVSLLISTSAQHQVDTSSNQPYAAVIAQRNSISANIVSSPAAAASTFSDEFESSQSEYRADETKSSKLIVDIVTGIGAGIYEELVFRLILICILMIILQDLLLLDRTNAIIIAVAASAMLFSLHHHIFFANGTFQKGEAFTLGRFVFRAIAGMYFAVIFAVRGFGITAGVHIFYNIIAAFFNAVVK